MRRWQVVIEGEAASKRFMRTFVVDAEKEEEATRIARTEFEKDADRFIEIAEVMSENSDARNSGVVSTSGRIFFG